MRQCSPSPLWGKHLYQYQYILQHSPASHFFLHCETCKKFSLNIFTSQYPPIFEFVEKRIHKMNEAWSQLCWNWINNTWTNSGKAIVLASYNWICFKIQLFFFQIQSFGLSCTFILIFQSLRIVNIWKTTEPHLNHDRHISNVSFERPLSFDSKAKLSQLFSYL